LLANHPSRAVCSRASPLVQRRTLTYFFVPFVIFVVNPFLFFAPSRLGIFALRRFAARAGR